MRDRYHKRPALPPIPPDKEDVGAWIAAILGVLFTLGVISWPGNWSAPPREPTRMAANTTTIAKTDPNQPPPGHFPQP